MEDIQKELRIRDRIMSIYTETEADFATPAEYDAYLETIEDVVYKLTNNIDVIETEEAVRDYQRRRADDAAAAAAAAPGAGGAAAAAAPAYMPQARGAAVQPQPLAPVRQDDEGKLLPPQPPGGARPTREQLAAGARAAGWSPSIPKQRALHEAFTTVFVH